MKAEPGAPAIDADLALSAPDLTVQGIPAKGVTADLSVKAGVLTYEILAESLGGKLRFRGDVPLTAEPVEARGQLQAVGFTLSDLWAALGVTGAPSNLHGQGAVDANVLATLDPFFPRASAVVEFRELRWGDDLPLGRLRGVVGVTPMTVQVHSLDGELLGGTVEGSAHPEVSGRTAFDLRLEQLALSRLAVLVPDLARKVEGTGRVTLRGTYGAALLGRRRGPDQSCRVAGLPIANLRLPTRVVVQPGGNPVGGGPARLRPGRRRPGGGLGPVPNRPRPLLHDEPPARRGGLEEITRLTSDSAHPASGRVSGRIDLSGRDPAAPRPCGA